MKLLLVVGLAAVVIVILIALVLSVRLGRGDEHEEPVRPGSRDRGHRDDEDSRWRDTDARDSHRPTRSGRAGSTGRDEPDTSGYRDEPGPSREQAARGRDRDYDYPDRRDAGPSEHPSSPRRVAAVSGHPGAGRDYRDRPADGRRDQRGSGQMDYPDYPSRPQRAAGNADYHSGPLPVPGFQSGEYPSADYPSMDFPSGPLAATDYPSGEFPAAAASTRPGSRGRSKSGPGKNGSGRAQPEPRRKPAKAQSSAKGRSRGKRDDDDDWPSTEWDKLSDEQYWAELSADKPLSTTARTAPPASEPTPVVAGNGHSRSANGKPTARHGASAPTSPAEPTRELPSRKAPSPPREPVTGRLPVRARPQPPVPARSSHRAPAASRAEVTIPRPAEEPSIAVLSSLATGSPARPHGALDEDPLTSPSFARPALDSRSYHRPDAPPAGPGVHPQPAARHASASHDTPSHGYGTPSYHPDSYRESAGYPSPAYPAASYRGSGPHGASPASPVASAPADGYQLPGQPGPGYAYPPAPAAQAAPGTWHQPPGEPSPSQGNPYGSYVDPAPASYQASPAMYPDSHPSGGHAYPPDLASSYPPPGFSPALAPYQAAMAAAGHQADPGHYSVAGVYPQAGYPSDDGYGYQQHASPAPYPDPQEAASYPPASGYPADPYQNGGYGYPAAQG